MVAFTTLSIAPNPPGAPKLRLVAASLLAAALAAPAAQARSKVYRCTPVVAVGGHPDEASRISRALEHFQIASQTTSSCGRWLVTASRDGGQLALQIDDGHGLILVRKVSNPDVAAAVIDSWVRRDLATVTADSTESRMVAAPVLHSVPASRVRQGRTASTHAGVAGSSKRSQRRLAAATPPGTSGDASTPASVPIVAPAAGSAVVAPLKEAVDDDEPGKDGTSAPKTDNPDRARGESAVVTRTAAAVSAAAARRGPGSLSLGTDVSVGSDGKLWWGGRLAACLTLGRACVGILARADRNSVASLEDPGSEPGTVDRLGTDLLATVGLPIVLGRGIMLMPEAGLGGGRLRSTVVSSMPDPSDPSAQDPPSEKISWGWRSTTRVVLSIPVWWRLALDVTGAFDTSFGNGITKPEDPGQAAVPADPRFFVRGGVALRYRAP